MSCCSCINRCFLRMQAAFGIGDAASKKTDEEEEKGLLDNEGTLRRVDDFDTHTHAHRICR